MPLAREQLGTNEQLFFIDDNPPSQSINGHDIVTYDTFKTINADEHHIAIAIANSQVREMIALKTEKDGMTPWSVRAKNTVIMDAVEIGEGALLSPFLTITSNIRIGRYFHANIACYVEHDCVIGDFVTFAPRASCNGNIVIEDHAYIGAGAVIKQGLPDKPLTIGRNAVVGMGAVVTKSVPANTVVVGNPAKVMT